MSNNSCSPGSCADDMTVFATLVRQHVAGPTLSPDDASCTMDLDTDMSGTFNTASKFIFGDGVQWLLRLPKDGFSTGKWTATRARHLRNTVELTRFIRRATKVPVPEVFAYGQDHNNPLGCPFVLEEFIDGTSVYDAWKESDVPDEEMHKIKANTIHDVAKAMVDLSRFTFSGIGSPTFTDGLPTFIKGSSLADVGPFMTTGLFEEGPYGDVESYIKSTLDQETDLPLDFYSMSLRMLMDWMLSIMGEPGPNVLFHPDLNESNIIVDGKTGHLKAIIDWDFTRAEPKAFGINSYPMFISRDWDGDSDQFHDVCDDALSYTLYEGETEPRTIHGKY